ncbi:MAG: hypothetical protein M3406_01085 [Chloroflexota bacterium]|nr:hypothetical protein [Chloroflexota bacterium]
MAPVDPTRVVWMVDDDPAFRELSAAVALDAHIEVVNLSADQLIERRGGEMPDGAMLDGSLLTGIQADEMLSGIPRLVICTARDYRDIEARWSGHPHVRVLLKPMELDAFGDAIRWLAGAEDSSSWPTPSPKPRS